MEENFLKLEKRVRDTLENTDLEKVFSLLEQLKETTICTGVGGSYVVSTFMSKVLATKNEIITTSLEMRDLLYYSLKSYQNIIIASYSGKNYGVDIALNTPLNPYLFSTYEKENIQNITYVNQDKEHSFISLSATLMPMSILLSYYLNGKNDLIFEILANTTIPDLEMSKQNIYEIMSGYESQTASTFLESTFIEAGIGLPIIHDKYAYCHGRSTTSYYEKHNMIYFNGNTELDKRMLKEFPKYYDQVISMDYKYEDRVVNDFYLTYKSMLLAKQIALFQKKDLSTVDYSPLVRKLYYFKGEM